jgi:hypothetical protein
MPTALILIAKIFRFFYIRAKYLFQILDGSSTVRIFTHTTIIFNTALPQYCIERFPNLWKGYFFTKHHSNKRKSIDLTYQKKFQQIIAEISFSFSVLVKQIL